MPDEFEIHTLNNYSHTLLRVIMAEMDLTAGQMADLIQETHGQISRELEGLGLSYLDAGLKPAITPRPGKLEIAFVFNTGVIDDGFYGMPIAAAWIPSLRLAAPKSSNSILSGDLTSHLPSRDVFNAMTSRLVERRPYLFRVPNQFHVIYITNLTSSQVATLDEELFTRTESYVGYADCSVWSPFKQALFLPALAVRLRNNVLMPGSEETDRANPLDYPFAENGFTVRQVDVDLFDMYLHFKIDNRVPSRQQIDGAFSLMGLSRQLQPLATLALEIDESRFTYLLKEGAKGHGASIRRAGLGGLTREGLAELVRAQIAKSLIFSLRARAGSRTGPNGARTPDPSLDALLFSVQIEVPAEDSVVSDPIRLMVGVKYFPEDHHGELITLF